MERNHKRWADELNEMRVLYEAEKEDNDFLRSKISDYLEAEAVGILIQFLAFNFTSFVERFW